MYELVAAVVATSAAFFYAVFQQKKVARLESDKKHLMAVAAKKAKTIRALETWIEDKEELKNEIRKVNNSNSYDQLDRLYKKAVSRIPTNSRTK